MKPTNKQRQSADELFDAVDARLSQLRLSQRAACEVLLRRHRSYLATCKSRSRRDGLTARTALEITRGLGVMLMGSDGHAIRTLVELRVRLTELNMQAVNAGQELPRHTQRLVDSVVSNADNASLANVIAVLAALGVRVNIVDDPYYPGLPAELVEELSRQARH